MARHVLLPTRVLRGNRLLFVGELIMISRLLEDSPDGAGFASQWPGYVGHERRERIDLYDNGERMPLNALARATAKFVAAYIQVSLIPELYTWHRAGF